MQRVDISRKRPTPWPFVAGLIVLAVVGWGVTVLLPPEPEPPPPEVPPSALDSMPPATIPAPPNDPNATAGITALAPLDARDLGRRVHASGSVVATRSGGYWLLVDGWVIQVESSRGVQPGDSLDVEGRLRESDAEPGRRIADEVVADNPDAASWRIVDRVKLVEGGAGREP